MHAYSFPTSALLVSQFLAAIGAELNRTLGAPKVIRPLRSYLSSEIVTSTRPQIAGRESIHTSRVASGFEQVVGHANLLKAN